MTVNGQLQHCWSSRWHWQVCFQVIWGHLLLCPLHIRTLRHTYTHGPHTLRARGRRPSRGSVKVSCEPAEWVSKERGSGCGASQVCIVYCLKGLICLTEWVSSLSAESCLCRGPQDLPIGTNYRMRCGNSNSFVRQRNPIHEFLNFK